MNIELTAQTAYLPREDAESIAMQLRTEGYIVKLRKGLNIDRFKIVAHRVMRPKEVTVA